MELSRISRCYRRGNLAMIALLVFVTGAIPQEAAQSATPSPDPSGQLWEALKSGDAVTIEQLLLAGADPNAADDESGNTPLVWAAYRDNASAAVVELLLDAGADPNAPDAHGQTALITAANVDLAWTDADRTDVVKLLLAAGGDVNAVNEDGGGWTPLRIALNAMAADTELVRLLIEAGADVNQVSSDPAQKLGQTPLIIAANRGHTEAVKLLLDAGADVASEDDYGMTALKRAEMKGHTAIAQMLKAGAEPRRSPIGTTSRKKTTYDVLKNEPYSRNLRFEGGLLGWWSHATFDKDIVTDVSELNGGYYVRGDAYYRRLATLTFTHTFGKLSDPYSLYSFDHANANALKPPTRFEIGGALHLSDREVPGSIPVVVMRGADNDVWMPAAENIRHIWGLRCGFFTSRDPVRTRSGKSLVTEDGTTLTSPWKSEDQFGLNVEATGVYIGISMTDFSNLTIRLLDGSTHRTTRTEGVSLDLLYGSVSIEDIEWRGRKYAISGDDESFETSKLGWRIITEWDGEWSSRQGMEIGKRPGRAGDYYVTIKAALGVSLPIAGLQ